MDDNSFVRKECDISEWCDNDCQKCDVGKGILLIKTTDDLIAEIMRPFDELLCKLKDKIERILERSKK